jgi:hypothetical protein
MITCNGKTVLGLTLSLPRVGAWSGWLELDSVDSLTGSVVLDDAGLQWSGTVLRSGVFAQRVHAWIVGGKGGLAGALPARSYVGCTAKLVATDIMAAAGEVLDPASDPLTTSLAYWTRANVSGGQALSTLCDAIGASWRIQPSGQAFVGTDTYKEQKLHCDELTRDDARGIVTIASDRFELRPGVTFGGRRVSRVEHSIQGNGHRTSYWVEAA